MILALLLQQPSVLQNKSEGRWEITATIPAFVGRDPLSQYARESITAKMTKDFNDFLRETKKDWVKGFESAPYGMESSATRHLGETEAQSYTVSTYRYLGGAHGLGVTECLNFALVNGKPKQITLWDVFDRRKSKGLCELIRVKAKKNPMTDWLQENEPVKTLLRPKDITQFWVKGTAGCAWEFDPYALGSYASGPFTFEFTWSELKPFLRTPNPLKKYIKP